MPWRKRLLVAAAVAFGALLLVASLLAIPLGHPGAGVTVLITTCVVAALVLQVYWVRWDLFGWTLRAGRPESRQVALTFDDGPGPDTPAILDALEDAGVRATFFVLGQAAAARPDLVREVARRGHLVALHGHTHAKLHFASSGTVQREIDRCISAIRGAGVEPAPFLRAPHGVKGPALRSALRRRKLQLVGWTRGVWDTERPGVDRIVGFACRRMRGGEILLLHDGCGTPGIDPRRDQTAAAVPELVRRWRGAGFEFVTVDRLERDTMASDRFMPPLAREKPLPPRAVTAGTDAGETAPGETARAELVPEKPAAGTTPDGGAAHAAAVPRTALPQKTQDALGGTGGSVWPCSAQEAPAGIFGVPERVVPPRVREVLRLAGIAAIVVLAVIAIRKLDADQIRRAFVEANLRFLFAAAAANVLALSIQTGRWLAVVHPVEPRARVRDAFFSLVAGYAIGIFVPARASDLARAYLMSKRSGSSTATLASTAVVDHLLGLIALIAALGVLAAVSPLPLWLRSVGTFAGVLAVGALTTLWFLRPRGLHGMPERGIAGFIARLRLGLVAIGQPRAVALSFAFAVAGWASEILIAHLALRAFELPAGIWPSVMCVLATTLSAAASVSPGNAGTFELACIVALSGFGVAREPALAFAIGYHAVHLIPTAVLGGGWLLARGHRASVSRGTP